MINDMDKKVTASVQFSLSGLEEMCNEKGFSATWQWVAERVNGAEEMLERGYTGAVFSRGLPFIDTSLDLCGSEYPILSCPIRQVE